MTDQVEQRVRAKTANEQVVQIRPLMVKVGIMKVYCMRVSSNKQRGEENMTNAGNISALANW